MKLYSEEERRAMIDAIEHLEKELDELIIIDVDCGSKSRLYKFIHALKENGVLKMGERTKGINGSKIKLAFRT